MNVDRIVHRTLFKHRLLLFVCLLFLVYILFSTDSLVTHLKIRLLSNRSFVRDTSQHKHGQFVSDENGNFMYYHLPNLDDYDIGQYYFELNSNGLEAYNETLTAKYCLRNGTDLVDVQQSSHQLKCLCKANYTGSECSIPPLINLTVESKLIANISRLRRPRRIVLSLVWLTYEYTDGNRTSKIIRLEHFTRTFEMMARYIDLFIVHELRLLTNESTIDDPYSLKSQFINGLLSKHSEYTLLYSRDIPLDQQNGQIDLEKLEFALMRQSWHLFTTRTTEYRPADLLIFLSINNFIHEDILLYLKYHAGLMDIIHLQPIQSTFLHQSNSTLFNITNEAVIISEFKFKSFISMSQNSTFPSNYSGGSFHLKNVIITFEFITFLCNYQFDLFVINYCLVDSKQLDHFKANFWPINLVSIGNDDLVIFPKDFPNAKIGDVVEIYSPEDRYSRLLLQITNLNEKHKKDAISIEASIASTFQLRNFSDVVVRIIDTNSVVLDSVELFFKDQYLARSDMWLLKKSITNTCVYLNKKVEFSNIKPCQVFEMWSQGVRMASGYINEETRVVYRSASSMVYLFLQMSSEMWDYDINGDLYFEKAVNGFLNDLFIKWKTFNCCHDVTIVFFSRTYYDAVNTNEFPDEMAECLQKDSKGRFYEDYYRVAIQNERYDDWTPVLIYLKKLFNLYEKEVIHYHEKLVEEGFKVPKGYNSNASQGNFLEVLNMSLNVFERHNLDRSFDRTGQLSVVISPGVGVYEVDLDLTNITKQRIIDNGIGSDLVCLGEQPLHAVPLFKFNSGPPNMQNDEYNMPHWINLSFYSSKKRFSSNFIPRIKMPNTVQMKPNMPKRTSLNLLPFMSKETSGIDLKQCQHIPSFIDFDEYDNQIFKSTSTELKKHTIQPSNISTNVNSLTPINVDQNNQSYNFLRPVNDHISKRRLSEVVPYACDHSIITPPNSPLTTDLTDGLSLLYERQQSHSQLSTSVENKGFKDLNKFKVASKDDIIVHKNRSEPHRTKALINPFDPTNVTIKLNSNRRRWTHVFPIGPTGIFIQQHHYQAMPQQSTSFCSNEDLTDHRNKIFSTTNKRYSFDQIDSMKFDDSSYRVHHSKNRTISEQSTYDHQKSRSLLTDNSSLWAWGATGELEWSHAITTGVDWKSLVIPACLPITTDFLPDKRTLQQDYVTYAYDLLPEDQFSDFCPPSRSFKNVTPTTDRVFMELICQRLQQGFQLILQPKSLSDRNLHILSIGRIYHELSLKDGKITLTNYHPRHPYNAKNIEYCYRIRTPDNETYGVSWVEFVGEKLESYKWNYLDNYICTYRGESDYSLVDNLKYWRFRLLVLPSMFSVTKKIINKYKDGVNDFNCDIYHSFSIEKKLELQAGFLKLIESINGIKRPIVKQTSRATETHKGLSRRYSSSAINSSLSSSSDSSTTSSRHSQPADTILNPITETQNRSSDQFSIKSEPISDTSSIKLSNSSPRSEIIEFMKNSNLFFIKRDDLPNYTFISFDAIEWAIRNIDKVDTEASAEVLFESLHSGGYIRHASGKPNKPFKRGFFLYCIMEPKNQEFFDKHRLESNFERDWMEVGVVHQHNHKYYDNFYEESSEFMSNNPKVETNSDFTFKNMVQDLDNSNKSGRVEWVNVKYHSLYDPDQAFELVIEWMVATGNAIPEIISRDWSRTKNTLLHIVPIPWDPFALPFSSKSDPLRGPIYISLNLECICSNNKIDAEQLFSFQEKILFKFGFIPFCDPSTDNQRNFVHVSGSIFVMIPSKNPASSPSKHSNKRGKFLMAHETNIARSPHEEYITRHFSGIQQKGQDIIIDAKIGFLWCWNYMITKRWKTNVTGDENSMRKIMQDFKAFCSNQNDRLKSFWDSPILTKDTQESE